MNNHQYPTIVYSRQEIHDKKLINNFLVDYNIKFTPLGNVYKDYQAHIRINNINPRQKYAFKAHFPAEHLRPLRTPSIESKKKTQSVSPVKKKKKRGSHSPPKSKSVKSSKKQTLNLSFNVEQLKSNTKSQVQIENNVRNSSRDKSEERAKNSSRGLNQDIAPQEQEKSRVDAAVECIQKEIIIFLQQTDPSVRESPSHNIQNDIRELCIKNLHGFKLDQDQALVVINRVMQGFGIPSGPNYNSNHNSESSDKKHLPNSGRLSGEKWGETTFGSRSEKDKGIKSRSSVHGSSVKSLQNPIYTETNQSCEEYLNDQKPTPRLGAMNIGSRKSSPQALMNENEYFSNKNKSKMKEYLDDQFNQEDMVDMKSDFFLNKSYGSNRSNKSNKSTKSNKLDTENHRGRMSSNSGHSQGRNSKNQNSNIKIMDESYQSYRNEDYESGDLRLTGNYFQPHGNYPSCNSDPNLGSYNSESKAKYVKNSLGKSKSQISYGGTPLSSNLSAYSSAKQALESQEESWDYRTCKAQGKQKEQLRIQNIVKKEVKVITAAELNAAIELRHQKEEEIQANKKSNFRSPQRIKKKDIIEEYQSIVNNYKHKSKSRSKSPQQKTLMVKDLLQIPSNHQELVSDKIKSSPEKDEEHIQKLLSESEILINTTPEELRHLRAPRYHSPKKAEIRRKLGDYEKFYKDKIETLNMNFIEKMTSTLKEFVRSNERSLSPIANRSFVFKYDPIVVEQAKLDKRRLNEEWYNEHSRKLLQKQIESVDRKQSKLLRKKSPDSLVDYQQLSSSEIVAYHKTLLHKTQLQAIENFRKSPLTGKSENNEEFVSQNIKVLE